MDKFGYSKGKAMFMLCTAEQGINAINVLIRQKDLFRVWLSNGASDGTIFSRKGGDETNGIF